MTFHIEIVFDDDTGIILKYRSSQLIHHVKKHPLYGIRKLVPILPWLIDIGLDYVDKDPHYNSIKRMDVSIDKVGIL